MFNLEKAIKEWKKSLRKNEALEDGYIAELECHLRDEFEDGIKNGKTEEASFIDAVKEVGEADTLGEAYYKTDTTHISKRPPWKESKWMPSLLSNYLKVAKRNIFLQKGYSFINITGLALGMACSFLLLLWVYHQQSFDKFHKNAKNLYRLEQDQKTPQGDYRVVVTKSLAGPTLKESLPEVKNTSRTLQLGKVLIKYKENIYYENTTLIADSTFLQMFTFPLIAGDAKTCLNNPTSIVLSESTAKKYFGDENPVGKTITLNNKSDFSVSGIMKDAPENSTIKPGILIPYSWLKRIRGVKDEWGSNFLITWVELNNGIQLKSINKKITDLITDRTISDASLKSTSPGYMLMPLTDINLFGYTEYDRSSATINSIKIYVILAFFILLMACINYMNLATARAESRAKEIGLRKTVGADRKNIIIQFFSESMLLAFVSFIFSLIFVILLLPIFNDLMNTKFNVGTLFNSEFLIILVLVALTAGIISGSYPALLLSSFNPVRALRGGIKLGSKSQFFRKALLVFQFCPSVILLICTIVAFQQVNFMMTKKVGYEKNNLIYLPLRGEAYKSYSTIKQELLKIPNVLSVSGINQVPTDIGTNADGAKWEGMDPEAQPIIGFAGIDYDYIETTQIEMAEGRSFSKSFPTDSSKGFLVNEEVLKVMGTKSGVGKDFHFLGIDGQIIGVMKNFLFGPAKQKIDPLVFTFSRQSVFAVVRLKGDNIPAALEGIKSVWQKFAPTYPLEYKFFDEDFAAMYKTDEQKSDIFKYGTFFAIIIACLGLFGFASFTTEKRTKEIGIRKVLGASVPDLTILLSKEFIKWVLIANVIAWPVAWVFLNNWLQDYAYRISIEYWVFIVSTMLTVSVAIITVGYRTIKAATANPGKSLKYE